MYNSKMLQAVFVNSVISFQNICEMRVSTEWILCHELTVMQAEIYQCKFIFLHFDVLKQLNLPEQIRQDFKKCFCFLCS